MGTAKEYMGAATHRFHWAIQGQHWLILVDTLIKWPEAVQMSSTFSECTIEVLRSLMRNLAYHSFR